MKPFFDVRNIHAENTMNLLLPLKCLFPVWSSFPLASVPPWYSQGACVHSLKWALGKVQGTIFLTGDGAVRHTAGWLQAPRSSTGTVPVVKLQT